MLYIETKCRQCLTVTIQLERVVTHHLPPNVKCLQCTRCGLLDIPWSMSRMLGRLKIKLSTMAENLWTTRPKPVQVMHIIAMWLTMGLNCLRCKRAPKGSSSLKLHTVSGSLCLFVSSLSFQIIPSYAATPSDHFKLYAHSRIIDDVQFQCFYKLINKENRSWNPKAKNGSHYGIGQMRNEKYKNLDGYRQIDWTLRYIKNRYGTICEAWSFFKAKGYH
jgi:hypothetical protein